MRGKKARPRAVVTLVIRKGRKGRKRCTERERSNRTTYGTQGQDYKIKGRYARRDGGHAQAEGERRGLTKTDQVLELLSKGAAREGGDEESETTGGEEERGPQRSPSGRDETPQGTGKGTMEYNRNNKRIGKSQSSREATTQSQD
ncbi:hypothetical protein C922_05516 [Plasmodium inui San Antonio 1]|uniref:Uncharacterized protein n=1 Tax=Plasmodium inui San Antonio 1 TaxID=1237626 RepID=W7A4T2_9APIC|nr:hypothetical protein C922_05516 [Plasmodium inui San Antonio 1]EUD64104.1 hypothetical protein C922_05516 [Plasmodium inui San Antonio 1]